MIDIQRFSCYQKLLRVTAYILRFISNCRNQTKVGPLATQEIDAAALVWIRSTQQRYYSGLTLNRQTAKKPNLVLQLNLHVDENKFLRCRGRIYNAPLDAYTKFPFPLPQKDRLTTLIIEGVGATRYLTPFSIYWFARSPRT